MCHCDTLVCYCAVTAGCSGSSSALHEDVSMSVLCPVNHIIYERFSVLYFPKLYKCGYHCMLYRGNKVCFQQPSIKY